MKRKKKEVEEINGMNIKERQSDIKRKMTRVEKRK